MSRACEGRDKGRECVTNRCMSLALISKGVRESLVELTGTNERREGRGTGRAREERDVGINAAKSPNNPAPVPMPQTNSLENIQCGTML